MSKEAATKKDAEPEAEGHPLTLAELPVSSLRDALPHLRRPFTPEAVQFKVQSQWPKDGQPTGCLVVSYITARLAIERLNAVCADLWSAEYQPLSNDKLLLCKLTIDGVTRQDIGESAKGLSKDLMSDALKRAAVQFGVGVSLYSMRQVKISIPDSAQRVAVRSFKDRDGKDKYAITLTDAGEEWLRAGYDRWLSSPTGRQFGPPLDHGDDETAGDEAEVPDLELAEDAVEALADERAQELQAEIQDAYERAIAARGPRSMPPGEFRVRLTQVHHDHAAMEAFRDYLRALAAPREVAA